MVSPFSAGRWRLLAVLVLIAAFLHPLEARAATYPVTAWGEAYGTGTYQKVTVNRPGVQGRRPVVYFIHGGSWVTGGRRDWAAQATDWASRGWVAINLDYTRAAEPGDGAKLLADVTAVVAKYEKAPYVNPARQIIVGDSAGGHLATTVAAKLRGHFDGVIAWSPVASPANAAVDGAQPGATPAQAGLGQAASRFFGYSAGTTSAFRYVAKYGGPPMWIAGSVEEELPWARQGGELCAALRTACANRLTPGTDHGNALRDNHPELQRDAYAWAMRQIGAWK